MNIWSWINQFEHEAYQNNDKQRIKMVGLFYEGMGVSDENPDLALNLLDQSRVIAQQCHELWWIQLVNHWELQYRIYNKRDLKNTLELAVQSTVETRKPHYAEFPQRICLHEDLIRVYLSQDPLGHMEMIQSALDFMESQLQPRVECFLCLQQLKISLKIIQGDLENANGDAHALLDYAANDRFHLCHAYSYLCEVAYHQKQWELIGQWAYLGEALAKKRRDNLDQIIEFMMWQAVYERYSGRETDAQTHFRLAATRARDYKGGLDRTYYDAVCAYHELGGEVDKALKARETFLITLIDTAQFHDEYECLLDIIRLRKVLDLPISVIRKQLENTIANMKNPTIMREKLHQLLNS